MSRVLVIPDVHLKPKIFSRAAKILDSGQADFAVQLGDLVDDWGEEHNLPLYERTVRAAIDFATQYPKTLWCMGNHDFGYYHPEYGKRETGHSKFAEQDMTSWLQEAKRNGLEQKVIHVVDGVIFSHAGLSKSWVNRQVSLMRADTMRLEDLPSIVNHAATDELWAENSPLWWRVQTDTDTPWGYWLQVMGHTPVERVREDSSTLLTDTFSTYSNGAPIGDQQFIIVETATKTWAYA